MGVMAHEGSMLRIDVEYFLEYVLVSLGRWLPCILFPPD
jgi:hypothetical protein